MKIAYLANSRFPSERAQMIQIVHMCNALAILGNEVTLFVTDRPTDIKDDSEKYYGLEFQFVIERIHVFDGATNASKSPLLIGVMLYTIQRISYVLSVRKRLQETSIIYGRDEWVLWIVSWFFPKKKLVFESHQAKRNFAVRKLFRKNMKCVVISEGIEQKYLKSGIPSGKLLVAHDGIDDSFFESKAEKSEVRRELGLPIDKKVAMYIGGFDSWKGVETFFAASELARDLLFAVIGGNEREVELYREKYPSVHFLGSRPYSELSRNQSAADVLVVPNTAKNELSALYTSPLKVFAHMTSEIPIVASDIPSLRSVLNSDSAYFFAADDPKALADALETVFKDYETYLTKAKFARSTAEKYTWKNRAKGIVNFLGD